MASVKSILKFSRIHTASLTIPVVVIAAVVAGYSLYYVFLFAVFALLFHAVGFSMNNVMDFKYDTNDANKQGFPSVMGLINMKHAEIAVWVGYVIAILFGYSIIGFGTSALSLVQGVFMLSAFISGVVYNVYNKRHRIAPLYIDISFGFLIPFVMLNGIFTQYWIVLLYTLFAVFTMQYQISVSGYIKDMGVPGAYNLMEKMGARIIANQIVFTPHVRLYGLLLRVWTAFFGIWIILLLYANTYDIVYLTVYVILQLIVFGLDRQMLRSQRWVHTRFLKHMSTIEVINYFSLIFVFAAVYGLWWVIFLTAFPILWFFGFNRLFFGTTGHPDV